jgi:Ni/Fe-hydrogenase subunit HybB-like protein
VIFAIAALIILWRLIVGLGDTTALNDGYPWGLWIAFDVVTGTALACGGYAIAILCYVFNKGRYHPLVRPAILASLFGYAMGGLSVAIDVGRYWLLYRTLMPWKYEWNFNSVLLEVAMCIMAYIAVLAIEILPAFLEKWQETKSKVINRIARIAYTLLDRALLPFFIALGILLPTMHQSSLGSLMLIAPTKVHPLWYTPWLPLLFLISCVGMGYAVVIFESSISNAARKRPMERSMLARLSSPIVFLLFLYVLLRLGDLVFRGQAGLIFSSGNLSILFGVEIALFLIPAFLLLTGGKRSGSGRLFFCAILMILAGGLYRFSVYLIAYDPGPSWSYFPAIPEILVTAGIVAFEILAYIIIVKLFPILEGEAGMAHA